MAALHILRDSDLLKLSLKRIRLDIMVFLASKMTKQGVCKSREASLTAIQRSSKVSQAPITSIELDLNMNEGSCGSIGGDSEGFVVVRGTPREYNT